MPHVPPGCVIWPDIRAAPDVNTFGHFRFGPVIRCIIRASSDQRSHVRVTGTQNGKTSECSAIERRGLTTQREHRALAAQTLELMLAVQVEGQTRTVEQVVGGRRDEHLAGTS